MVFLQTKAQSVAPAITESLKVLAGMQTALPRGDEMAEKKTALANSYILNFDSTDDIAGRHAYLQLLNYPSDYDQTYLSKIQEVSPEAVEGVAQKRWNPEKFVIVVVGNEQAYRSLEQSLKDPAVWPYKFDLNKLRFESSIVMQ